MKSTPTMSTMPILETNERKFWGLKDQISMNRKMVRFKSN